MWCQQGAAGPCLQQPCLVKIDPSQGVGYLDDGTMVVVENGKKRLGETLKVEATSLLQTESGRIIFTKVKA